MWETLNTTAAVHKFVQDVCMSQGERDSQLAFATFSRPWQKIRNVAEQKFSRQTVTFPHRALLGNYAVRYAVYENFQTRWTSDNFAFTLSLPICMVA